jgi:hypothetical protein
MTDTVAYILGGSNPTNLQHDVLMGRKLAILGEQLLLLR